MATIWLDMLIGGLASSKASLMVVGANKRGKRLINKSGVEKKMKVERAR